MSKASWTPVLVMALAVSTSSIAESLTERDFLADAIANHPEIAAAEAAVAAAQGSRRQTGIVGNPVVTWEREDPDSQPRQDTWSLDWRLPFDGRKHRVAAGDAAIAGSAAILDATRLEIRIEMRSVFAAWYLAAERAQVLQVHLERTERFARWLRDRADHGEAAGVEAKRLDFEVEILRREVVQARAEALARRAGAAVWSPRVANDVKPSRPLLAPPPDAAGTGDRPDLEALSQRVAEVDAQAKASRRALEPPAISIGWTEIRDGEISFDGPVYGIAWPIPVFDRNQGHREQGDAEVQRARFVLDAARRHADAQVQAALAAYSELYGSAVSVGDDSTDADVAAAVFAAFEAGEAGLTDVLDAHRSTVELRLARLDSLSVALTAERELEAALGRPVLPGGSS